MSFLIMKGPAMNRHMYISFSVFPSVPLGWISKSEIIGLNIKYFKNFTIGNIFILKCV